MSDDKPKPQRRKPIVYRATFNENEDLRINYQELLLWAVGLLEAKEGVRELIKKEALREFEKDLDGHLRVMEIDVKVAEIVRRMTPQRQPEVIS